MWRGEHTPRLAAAFLALTLTACAGGGTGADASVPSDDGTAPLSSSSSTPDTTTPDIDPSPGSCAIPSGEPFVADETVALESLGESEGVTVRGALYPHPDYEGNPWSQWGQGLVLDDGRFFSAIGDHIGVDGNSYVYEYDPASGELTLVGDVLSYVDHVPGTWGYGKVHSQMVPGPCGEIYFSTYWGTFRDIEFEGNYTGDILFRLDPFGRTLKPLGVPIEHHGTPSLGSDPEAGLIYGEAVDPIIKADDYDWGPFYVYDVRSEEVTLVGPEDPHYGFRSVMVDAEGNAYYSAGGDELTRYGSETGSLEEYDERLPAGWLRAATGVAPDGSVYGSTRDPDAFFVMNPDGTFDDLGPAVEYTASVALAPDGSAFYYMPGAHGDSAEWGSPLIRVDTDTGEQTTIVELNAMVEGATGYTVGGTYNVAVSSDGSEVYMGVNVGVAGSEETFAEVMLLVIELP